MKHNTFAARAGARCRPAPVAGFSLIELLISVTIGLGILAGLLGVLAANSGNSKANDRTSELMTNGRYALNSMKQELREAGFRGYTWAEPVAADASVTASALTKECLEGGAAGQFVSNIRQPVWGANDTNPFDGVGNCIQDADYSAGNDVLVVRRLGILPVTALVAGTVYFQSSYEKGQLFRGTVVPAFTGPPSPLASFPLQTYVYYISPFTVSAAEVPLVPALFRMSLDSTGTMVRELVASGIERMQVQYGQLTADNQTRYWDSLAGASFSNDATVRTDWEEVNSVRLWLLARNSTTEPGYVNPNTYTLGSAAAYTPGDGFRRLLFSTVVQLRN